MSEDSFKSHRRGSTEETAPRRPAWICACHSCPAFATLSDANVGSDPQRWCQWHFDERGDSRRCDEITARIRAHMDLLDAFRLARLSSNDRYDTALRAQRDAAFDRCGYAEEIAKRGIAEVCRVVFAARGAAGGAR